MYSVIPSQRCIGVFAVYYTHSIAVFQKQKKKHKNIVIEEISLGRYTPSAGRPYMYLLSTIYTAVPYTHRSSSYCYYYYCIEYKSVNAKLRPLNTRRAGYLSV
jgi:hypothetical protein